MVRLYTTLGPITIELDHQRAPKTVENFLAYVDARHYDGTLFHRVIPGFMVQGGGFERRHDAEADRGADRERGRQRPARNAQYTVAMARTSDPHSATAQFFINVADNEFLEHTAPTARAGATRCSAR